VHRELGIVDHGLKKRPLLVHRPQELFARRAPLQNRHSTSLDLKSKKRSGLVPCNEAKSALALR
jgi:hypothetical protein